MCCGASYWSQISRIVYAATEPKRSPAHIHQHIIHPKTKISGGIMAEEASQTHERFFCLQKRLK